MTRAGQTTQPVFSVDPNTGKAAVRFDGNDILTNAYNPGASYTIFTVSSIETTQARRLILPRTPTTGFSDIGTTART